MKWNEKRVTGAEDWEIEAQLRDNFKAKPFHQTYKYVTTCMSFGMLYPNPATEKFRLLAILMVYTSVTPVTYMIFFDMYNSYVRRDILNIIRHCTVIIPFWLVLTKTYLLYHQRVTAKEIIDEIDQDHELCNDHPAHYKLLFKKHLKTAKFSERYWFIIVCHVVLVFPVMSSVLNIYYAFQFPDEPYKYQIHDVNLPYMPEEARFESPYFELMFVYLLYCCSIYFLNFIGYDGFFGIAIHHACYKMRLNCMKLDDALKADDPDEILKKVAEIVRAQCRVYTFVETIQKTFNFWLGTIFIGTVVHMCNCVYQFMEGFGFDLRYLIFIAGSVVHIYLPCKYASKLQSMSDETSTLIYSSGWEDIADLRLRKMILFMIARAQIPVTITAFNIITFDMELFVSILHTSYSMFTLFRE